MDPARSLRYGEIVNRKACGMAKIKKGEVCFCIDRRKKNESSKHLLWRAGVD